MGIEEPPLIPLRFTSCQAPVAEAFAAAVARFVGDDLGIAVEFVAGMPWQERQRGFDTGRIHVCWMCGLPYVWRSDRSAPHPVLLAALVPAGPRYADRPVYFSDVVVRRESAWTSFAGLEGATWAYNEDSSHSGYNAVRERLARLQRPRGFFGTVIASGSHEASLGLLLKGEVDACAVDSTVLDLLGRDEPALGQRLRVIESIGPSPAPPWVASPVVPPSMRQAIARALLAMAGDARGRLVLDSGMAARFAEVADSDYDPIRRMERDAQPVVL
jgi:phosphonate transport system substrate-binding protein